MSQRRNANFNSIAAPKIGINAVTGNIEHMIWSHAYREGVARASGDHSEAAFNARFIEEFISFGTWCDVEISEMRGVYAAGKRAGRIHEENMQVIREERAAGRMP